MEITAMQLYWILKLDTISFVLCLLAALSGCLFAVVSSARIAILLDRGEDSGEAETMKRAWWASAAMFIPLLLLAVAVPDTKDFCVMYAVPKIVNSDQVRELGRDSLKVASMGLKRLEEIIGGVDMSSDGEKR